MKVLKSNVNIQNSKVVIRETTEKVYDIDEINRMLDNIRMRKLDIKEDSKRLADEYQDLLKEEQKYMEYLKDFNDTVEPIGEWLYEWEVIYNSFTRAWLE